MFVCVLPPPRPCFFAKSRRRQVPSCQKTPAWAQPGVPRGPDQSVGQKQKGGYRESTSPSAHTTIPPNSRKIPKGGCEGVASRPSVCARVCTHTEGKTRAVRFVNDGTSRPSGSGARSPTIISQPKGRGARSTDGEEEKRVARLENKQL